PRQRRGDRAHEQAHAQGIRLAALHVHRRRGRDARHPRVRVAVEHRPECGGGAGGRGAAPGRPPPGPPRSCAPPPHAPPPPPPTALPTRTHAVTVHASRPSLAPASYRLRVFANNKEREQLWGGTSNETLTLIGITGDEVSIRACALDATRNVAELGCATTRVRF